MSNYTKIQACVTDQSIQLRNVPLIASGGRNEVRVDFTFCSLWESTAKTAVFYRDPEQAYHVLLVENSAVVPAEVLASDGLLYFGVFGTSEEQVRTTEVISLKVAKGAITYQGTTPEEPAPDIYTQLMSAYGKTEAAIAAERVRTDEMVAVERARINELVAMRGNDGTTQIELSAENVSGTIRTNGFHVHMSFYISNVSIEPGSSYYTDYFIPEKLLPFTRTELLNTYKENVYAEISVILQDGMARLGVNNQSGETLNSVSIFGESALNTPYIGELADLRVGADGTTYPTAGEAVRKQLGAVGGSVAPMIVTIRDERPSDLADAIIEHLANGGNAILIYNEEYLALDHYDDELVSFVRTNVEEGIAHQVDIYNDGTFDAYVFQAAGHSYVTDLVPTDAHINALIDAKLAALNSAEGVEF